MKTRIYYVYILTNRSQTVLYTGVTNNIIRRVSQHRSGNGGMFTKKYKVRKLVYVHQFEFIHDAITAEKTIKGWSRDKKIALINSQNPDWKDLLKSLL